MGSSVILSLGAARAFDSPGMALWELLKLFGLGDRFIGWVQLLYSNTQASMLIKVSQSESFPLL